MVRPQVVQRRKNASAQIGAAQSDVRSMLSHPRTLEASRMITAIIGSLMLWHAADTPFEASVLQTSMCMEADGDMDDSNIDADQEKLHEPENTD